MMAMQHHAMPEPTLGVLLEGLNDEAGSWREMPIHALAVDSRKVQAGGLFCAVAGTQAHGMTHLANALAHGAVAVVMEPTADYPQQGVTTLEHQGHKLPCIPVSALGQRLGEIASRFFGEPSHALEVIGITGTNGKTSVSQFIAQALEGDGPCGVIGTLGTGLCGELAIGEGRTTPDAVTLQGRLAEFLAAGARHAVMEVSSHGLEQGRVSGVRFDTAVFTNLTPEHLDYHGDMASYAAAKGRLFTLPGLRHTVLNLDDAQGRVWAGELQGVEVLGYGMADGSGAGCNSLPRITGSALELGASGISMMVDTPWGSGELSSPLLGRFNAENLLAALGALLVGGMTLETALQRLSRVTTVPGRMERHGGSDGQPLVVVDYAHTADALEQVLSALRAHTGGKLWCVFGCGGDRDRLKRPMMAAVTERLADRVVITNDNPRHEDALGIIEEIMTGMTCPDDAYVKPDRSEAIGWAVTLAAPEDVVLVAGKGHETEQWVGDRALHFSDSEAVEHALQRRGHG